MKIEHLPGSVPGSEPVRKKTAESHQDYAKVFQAKREQTNGGVTLPKQSSRSMVQDFAEWYFKLGKTYEGTRNYDLAISAYEKSNSVKPDIDKMRSVDDARHKEFADSKKKG